MAGRIRRRAGDAHAVGHGHADHAHRGSGAKGRAGQHRDHAAQQEGGQNDDLRMAKRDAVIYDKGNRTARSPQGGEGADQNKCNQDIFDGLDAGQRHQEQLPQAVLFAESVCKKHDKTKQQRHHQRHAETDG